MTVVRTIPSASGTGYTRTVPTPPAGGGGGGGLTQTVTTYTPDGTVIALGAADANGMRAVSNGPLDGLTVWDPFDDLLLTDTGTAFKFVTTSGGNYPINGAQHVNWYTKGPLLILAVGKYPSTTDYVEMVISAMGIGAASSRRVACGFWRFNAALAQTQQAVGVEVWFNNNAPGPKGLGRGMAYTGGVSSVVATGVANLWPMTARAQVKYDTATIPPTQQTALTCSGMADTNWDATPGVGPGCYLGIGIGRGAATEVELSSIEFALTSD